MKLHRLRVLLTVAYAVVALAAVVPLAMIATSEANRRIDAHTRSEAVDTLERVIREQLVTGQRPTDEVAWYVSIKDGQYSESIREDPPVEPPLFSLVDAAGQSPLFDTFRPPGGPTYLAYVRPLDEQQFLVTALDLTPSTDAKSSRHLQIYGLGALAVLVAALAGWFVTGRALGPARQAVRDQQGFLADAAHEMRTPLAVILASASQALSRDRGTEEYVRSLSEIRAAAERAAAGVNELLDLARFDSGQAIPRLAPLRLDLLAEEVAASIRTDGCVLRAEPGAAVVVDADMALLRQAIDNVVRNATRRAKEVAMTTTVDGRDGVLEVRDDGAGFDPAVLPYVFDRYRRGDTRGNAGMGLAIVRAILAAHGGAIEAANHPDGGAVVRLRIPLTRTAL